MSRIGEDAQEWWDQMVANLAADGLEIAPLGTTAERDEMRFGIKKLIPWAESYRMHHVVIALRELLAPADRSDNE